ncbi:MAG: hypothetical protein KDI46_08275 [Alphaproteobacteria bacterium]|nr:hypothetical protein [Alphaproteobacteria bacterium]
MDIERLNLQHGFRTAFSLRDYFCLNSRSFLTASFAQGRGAFLDISEKGHLFLGSKDVVVRLRIPFMEATHQFADSPNWTIRLQYGQYMPFSKLVLKGVEWGGSEFPVPHIADAATEDVRGWKMRKLNLGIGVQAIVQQFVTDIAQDESVLPSRVDLERVGIWMRWCQQNRAASGVSDTAYLQLIRGVNPRASAHNDQEPPQGLS